MSRVQTTTSDVDVDLGRLFASLAANWRRIVLVAFVITAAAFVLAWLSTPQYMGETRILIETRESVFTRPETATGDNASSNFDEEGVTSQVELIGSTDLLKRVAQKLALSKLPEFDEAAEMSTLGRLMVLAGLSSDPTEIPPEERVLKAFREKLKIFRVEKSRVIVIEMSSEDPQLAALIPNTLADEYLAVQRDAKLQSNADATEWLEPEIADLTKRVKEAEARVATYRSQSDLLVGNNNSVLATQQLSELSSELSRVRASRGVAEATADSVRAALKDGVAIDSLPTILSSDLIQRLRERQVQLRADIADLSTSLLDGHPRIRALNSQLSDLNEQIRDEAQKLLKGLETEARTARARENQLIADLNTLKAESARAGDQEVELKALEREATAQRQLLESYLTRYREASSRRDRSYQPVDARVFSRAIAPAEPYFPKMVPIVGAAFVASLLIMAVVTLLQELFSGRAMRPAGERMMEPVEQVRMPFNDPAGVPAAANLPGTSNARPRDFTGLTIERVAEKLIAGGTSRAIFVSPEGDEAAASAVLVAREIADSGLRVLLLDLTSTGAATRPMLESNGYPGITNLLAAEAQFGDVIHSDLYSDCHVIPVGTADQAKAMRAVDRLPIILNSLGTAYDVVVVECGPADAASLGRITSDAADVLVSVIDETDGAVAQATDGLKAGGYKAFTLVSPVGHQPPSAPRPGHTVAA